MSDQEMPSHHGIEEGPQPPREAGSETLRLLLERASCRDFSGEPIPSEVLGSILEVGLHAATGGNLQPYSILVIEEAETRRHLAELCEQGFMGRAPVHLLICIDWHRLERWSALQAAPFTATRSFRHFWISFQDAIISAQTICTAADSVGLGSVYIGTIMEFWREARTLFRLPPGVLPVVLVCLGRPSSRAQPRRKLASGTVIHRERYHDPTDEELLAAFQDKYAGVRVEATEERRATLAQVCRAVQGEELARRALARVQQDGFINAAQRYFGLHYRADQMPRDNDLYLRIMEEFGFEWFRAQDAPGEASGSSADST